MIELIRVSIELSLVDELESLLVLGSIVVVVELESDEEVSVDVSSSEGVGREGGLVGGGLDVSRVVSKSQLLVVRRGAKSVPGAVFL